MKCYNCHKILPDNIEYCAYCGKRANNSVKPGSSGAHFKPLAKVFLVIVAGLFLYQYIFVSLVQNWESFLNEPSSESSLANEQEVDQSPVVLSEPAVVTSVSSALLEYKIETDKPADYWFEYGETTSLEKTTSSKQIYGSQKVVEEIGSLKPGTKYYYRLVVKIDNQKYVGNKRTFLTAVESEPDLKAPSEDEPRVNTGNVLRAGDTSVHLKGEIEINNSGEYWFEYGKTTAMEESSFTSKIVSPQNVKRLIVGLDPDTKYYYRLVVKTGKEEYHGKTKSFIIR